MKSSNLSIGSQNACWPTASKQYLLAYFKQTNTAGTCAGEVTDVAMSHLLPLFHHSMAIVIKMLGWTSEIFVQAYFKQC
jgi:hypothetical protein